jgi:hypothetical protein
MLHSTACRLAGRLATQYPITLGSLRLYSGQSPVSPCQVLSEVPKKFRVI